MAMAFLLLVATLLSAPVPAAFGESPAGSRPETVDVPSGALRLRGLLWRPPGRGPFPAVLLNHGSGRSREQLERLGPYEGQAEALGPVFARHGYVFLYLFRRGVGLSAERGANSVDLMARELAAHGQDARNRLQLKLLETTELDDARAGLAFLRALPEVDTHALAIVGHSFGGSLTLLMAERDPSLRAAVVFSAAGHSWDLSPPLRARLLAATGRAKAALFFIHAANDHSIAPGEALDAERTRLGKPHRLKVYPPVGQTADDGHSFIYLGVPAWEADVFSFLDEHLRR